MITKVQGKTLRGECIASKPPKLSAVEKGMLKWAVVTPDDRVLDANIRTGLMAEYLRRNLQCEVCGVSPEMEDVRRARARLQSCDIVYACRGDIPWRDEAFDTVLLQLCDSDQLSKTLSEAYRVLKPGGQLVLGLRCYPGPLDAARRMLADDSTDGSICPAYSVIRQQLEALSFQKVTWQRTSLISGVLIAWKPNETVATFLEKDAD